MVKPKGKYAWSVKVGEKGQIVIPKEARDVFGISPGDTLILLGDDKRGLAIPTKNSLFSFTTRIFGDTEIEEGDE
ncbi:MAG TPA: AbrB/MazE/SpoVT family DNA-binding domain-containing protein [Clostridiaceae bacterium]|nr:AbrB/MazE/SpoVT family DNA-binding domain-containing protein [Clostridiaceae bacterium]